MTVECEQSSKKVNFCKLGVCESFGVNCGSRVARCTGMDVTGSANRMAIS